MGLQQGFQWMAGTEWLDSILSMRPYWFVRTMAGISMDIGMTLLVINMMMTALGRPVRVAEDPIRPSSGPGRWSTLMTARASSH